MKYLKFNKYLIKTELEAIFLFIKYFYEPPKKGILKKISILFESIAIEIIKPLIKSKDKTETLIKRFGIGKNGSLIELIRIKKREYIIQKTYKNSKNILKEKKFYNLYKKKLPHIRMPHMKFSKNKIIIQFIKKESLAKQLQKKQITFKKFISIFNKINSLNNKHYIENQIHGDLTPCNTYISNNDIIMIDFGDTHTYTPKYDSYIFLKRGIEYYFESTNYKIIKHFFSKKEIKMFENHFKKRNTLKNEAKN